MEEMILEDGTQLKIAANSEFRGWDAADELIISKIESAGHTLILEDTNGVISAAAKGPVTTYTSSVLNRGYIESTIELNGSEGSVVTDFTNLPAKVDLIIIKLPKFIDLLEYFLQVVGDKYPGTPVIIGGMVKYMPISMVRLTEEYFTDVTTSLAKKKARLILGTASNNCESAKSFPNVYKLENGDSVASYPGIFSGDHLDIGTRFLLENIPTINTGTILDLGCGSGVLGLKAKRINPDSDIVLCDISYTAIESAKESFKLNDLEATYSATNILEGVEKGSIDLIICNPPFHNGNRVATDVANEMFKQSKKVLKPGGQLILVANKHLGYHKILRTLFHNLNKVAENEKFFIYSVRKV
jgi:23S rRNA (guanine1835-N2)-methyltransferase